jgi:PhnB protein
MVLMASDFMSTAEKLVKGNNFSISIDCESLEETERLFNQLTKNGKVIMTLGETFWVRSFGMLTDQFGINWMINLEK